MYIFRTRICLDELSMNAPQFVIVLAPEEALYATV